MSINRNTMLSLLIELLKELEVEEHDLLSKKATPANLHRWKVILDAKELVTELAQKLNISTPELVIHAIQFPFLSEDGLKVHW